MVSPYGSALLTPEGLAAAQSAGEALLTSDGVRLTAPARTRAAHGPHTGRGRGDAAAPAPASAVACIPQTMDTGARKGTKWKHPLQSA